MGWKEARKGKKRRETMRQESRNRCAVEGDTDWDGRRQEKGKKRRETMRQDMRNR